MLSGFVASLPERLGHDLFVAWCRAIWSAIRDSYEAANGPGSFRLHKRYEPVLLRRAYPNIIAAERQVGLIEAATTLLSMGIVIHPFENANHRTFIAATRIYLGSNGVRFPPYLDDSRWKREASAFVRRSKKIRLELSEVAYPGEDFIDRIAEKHEAMTRRWLVKMLPSQSGRLSKDGIISIRRLIESSESSG